MLHKYWMVGLAVLALEIVGCGKSETEAVPTSVAGQSTNAEQPADTTASTASPALPNDPAGIVRLFLEAYRNGDDEKAVPLLSTVARRKMAEAALTVTPSRNDRARFEIGQVEYLTEDGKIAPTCPANCGGARVHCQWIETDETGRSQSDHVLWVLRPEDEGWRVVGMAVFLTETETVLLSYENPPEMKKKVEWLQSELARREQPEKTEAERGKNSKDSIRR